MSLSVIHNDTIEYACPGGAVSSVAVRAAWLRWSESLGSRPRLAGSLCQVIAAYAFSGMHWKFDGVFF